MLSLNETSVDDDAICDDSKIQQQTKTTVCLLNFKNRNDCEPLRSFAF